MITNLSWAGNYLVASRVVDTVGMWDLVWWRWALAVPPLILIAHLVEKPDWRGIWRHWRWLLLTSFTGVLAFTVLLYAALEFTTALTASVISAVNPAVIAVTAAIFLRERLTWLGGLGVVVALSGVLLVLTEGDWSVLLTGGFGTGELLMLGAGAVWTAYTLIARATPPVPPITATAAQALIAVVVLTPVILVMGGPAPLAGAGTIGAVVFLALFPSVLAYLLWNRALTVVSAGVAGVSMNLITVFIATYTIAVGDTFTWAQVVGAAIVILGVLTTHAQALRRRAAVAGEARLG